MSDNRAVRLRRTAWHVIPLMALSVLLLGQAAPPAPSKAIVVLESTCEKATDALAAAFLDQWKTAIQSQHPDHVARLFSLDAAMQGFASPVVRSSYATIREYWLYFFQYHPQVRLERQQSEAGCNFLINTGTYSWTMKSRSAADSVLTVPVRYRMIYEYAGSRWQLVEHVEEATLSAGAANAVKVPDPQAPHSPIIVSPEGPAVAGFMQRASPPAANTATHHLPPLAAPNHLGAPHPTSQRPARPAAHKKPVAPATDDHWMLQVFQRD